MVGSRRTSNSIGSKLPFFEKLYLLTESFHKLQILQDQSLFYSLRIVKISNWYVESFNCYSWKSEGTFVTTVGRWIHQKFITNLLTIYLIIESSPTWSQKNGNFPDYQPTKFQNDKLNRSTASGQKVEVPSW